MASIMRVASPPPSGAPPVMRIGLARWMRRNLFSNWLNSLLTVLAIWVLYMLAQVSLQFISHSDWTVVTRNLTLFAIGQYPRDQAWRTIASLGIVAALWIASALVWKRSFTGRRILIALWIVSPVMIAIVLGGLPGSTVLSPVRTQLWGGLLLTFALTVTGIVVSFPFGVALALGRRSDLIMIKGLCTIYIEVVRGVPLITILFMAQVMLQLFLATSVDVVIRAMVGIILFSAAYIAEIVRGGLQAIPRGQIEAAQSLGLNPLLVTGLIILPQALRIVIPAMVGQFISLFKDTTLVSVVTLLELLGIAKSAIAQNPAYQFHKTEVYIFLAAIYFGFSYVMSSVARRLEASTVAMGGTYKL